MSPDRGLIINLLRALTCNYSSLSPTVFIWDQSAKWTKQNPELKMFAASTVQHYSFWEENGEDWTVSCWLPSLSPLWELELIFENFTDCHLFCVPWVAAHASMSSSVSNLNLILQNSLWKIWIQINQLISIDVTGWHTCWPSLLPGLSSLPATVTAYTDSELSDYADPVHQLLISTDISVGELRNSPNVHCC